MGNPEWRMPQSQNVRDTLQWQNARIAEATRRRDRNIRNSRLGVTVGTFIATLAGTNFVTANSGDSRLEIIDLIISGATSVWAFRKNERFIVTRIRETYSAEMAQIDRYAKAYMASPPGPNVP